MGDENQNTRLSAFSRRDFVKGALATAATPAVSASVTTCDDTARTTQKELSCFGSTVRMIDALRKKQISSEELVKLHLERIQKIDPAINALVGSCAGALDLARESDQKRMAGEVCGPLHGVPMTIKDCFDTVGVVSSWGTEGRKNFVPSQDATVVKRLRDAGAILLGKTNTPEFTLSFETWNRIYGFTHNPYDLNRSPGGSSGGAAALIAAGGTPFDIGTDYAGSIRVPAHFCGITGIKPTAGSIPRTGLCLPAGLISEHLSHIGPMARYVEDLHLLLPLLWGPDSIDSHIVPVPYPAALSSDANNLRCLVTFDNGIATPTEETLSAIDQASTVLRKKGIHTTEGRLPLADQVWTIMEGYGKIATDASIFLLMKGAGTDPARSSLKWFRKFLQSLMGSPGSKDIADHFSRVEQFRSTLLKEMCEYDLILSPVNPIPAPLHPEEGNDPFPIDYASYTAVFDITGWPSGVVRAGTSPEGLPIGVQLTANPWREDLVLAILGILEDELGGYRPPAIPV